jgi:hypothetical protein
MQPAPPKDLLFNGEPGSAHGAILRRVSRPMLRTDR